jgi:hypothetical protein
MKKFYFLTFCILILLTACIAKTTADPQNISTTVRLCQSKDLIASTNSIIIDSDILQGITISNTSKTDCVLKDPPTIVVLNNEKTDITESGFSISLTGQAKTSDTVLLARDGGNQVFTIRWISPCDQENLPTYDINLVIEQNTYLSVPKMEQKLPLCKTSDEKLTLNLSYFTSPP